MKKDVVLRKNPDFVARVIEDETVLLPVYKSSDDINCIYSLNPSSSAVWELINGKRPLSSIKEELLKRFDSTAEEINKELSSLLKDLKKIKAVI